MSQDHKKSPPPIFFIVALGLIAFGAYKFLPGLLKAKTANTPTSTSAPIAPGAIANRISLGNQILVTSQTTPDKQAGVQAFAEGDYQAAAQYFQKSLQQNRNDPETITAYSRLMKYSSRYIYVV